MKIKKGLVVDQTEGTLIGFTDHGLCFKNNNNKLASQMLGVYVKGISGSLSQILAYFPTDTAKAHHLTGIFWDALCVLETQCGLRVMAVIADGSSDNRKFFSNLVCGSNFDFKFTNPFSMDRDIFLWPDPPHLMKTARNAMLKN